MKASVMYWLGLHLVVASMRSMRAFRMVTAVLLCNIIKDGPNTFEYISQYLYTVREPLISRLWVECFIRPMLIAHQFERAERECYYVLQQHCYPTSSQLATGNMLDTLPGT